MTLKEAMQRLASVDLGMISDSMLRLGLGGWMDGVHAVGEALSFAGPAKTMLIGPRRGIESVPQSKYAIVEGMEEGEVLVVGGMETTENQMGGNVALHAQKNGVAAIVCGTLLRDRDEMAALDMPVYAKGATAKMPVSTDIVALDVPIVCAGAQVRPGDILIGSTDGVLVIPRSRLEDVLFQLEDIEEIETALQRAVRDGKPLAEIEALAGRKKNLRAAKGD